METLGVELEMDVPVYPLFLIQGPLLRDHPAGIVF